MCLPQQDLCKGSVNIYRGLGLVHFKCSVQKKVLCCILRNNKKSCCPIRVENEKKLLSYHFFIEKKYVFKPYKIRYLIMKDISALIKLPIKLSIN